MGNIELIRDFCGNFEIVLLYSLNFRTGSSFLSDLLSIHKFTGYFFEPFYPFQPILWNKSISNEYKSDLAQKLLEGIYECSGSSMSIIKESDSNKTFQIRHKPELRCEDMTSTVIKTIRLRRSQIESWIGKTSIKIMYLIRDPRAIYRSYKIAGYGDSIGELCASAVEDVDFFNGLKENQVFISRYEDVVDDTYNIIRAMYAFGGLIYNRTIENAIYEHTHANDGNDKFFGTFRESDFEYNQWKYNLTLKVIKMMKLGLNN